MMLRFVRSAGIAALLCAALATPTFADEASLRTHLLTAFNGLTSYHIDLSTVQGAGGSITVLPSAHRSKLQLTFAQNVVEVYTIGDTAYQHANSGPWTKRVASNPAAMMHFGFGATTTSKIDELPDTTENGKSVGSYSVEADNVVATPGAPPRTLLTCTYDKATYLNRTCRNQNFVLKFSNYNDPTNVVELPDAAKAAPNPVTSPGPRATQ